MMAPTMVKLQGFRLYPNMAYALYGLLFPSVGSKFSRSALLSLIQWWQVCCAHCYIGKLTRMAPVVRVEPYQLTLLDSNPDLLRKIEDVGWLQFLEKFSDSNPEVTRVSLGS